MTRRKGELSAARIDREWPHQVALPADQGIGENYKVTTNSAAGSRFARAGTRCGGTTSGRPRLRPHDARRIVTRMGRDPASRLSRDLQGSVSAAS